MIDTSHLNIFDIAVIGIMVMSCLFAFFRGLVREILSLAAWIGAGIVTLYYFPQFSEKLQPHFKNPMVAAGAATALLYFGALMVFALINTIIIKSIKHSEEAGMLDNVLGLMFGAIRGALIISLGFFLITVAIPEKEYPDWLQKSVTRPYAEKGAKMLAQVAPEYLQDLSNLQKKATEEMARQNEPPETDGQNPSAGVGYNRQTTNQLDRMINSTEPHP